MSSATSKLRSALGSQYLYWPLRLVKPGEPWYGSAGELTAMAYIKQGKKAEAGRLFAAIAADKQVPDSIRARAVQIAGTLGVDASASLPASAQ